MPRPGRSAWRAALAVGLLWLTVGPAARVADAMGCHVPERPALGLDHAGWLLGIEPEPAPEAPAPGARLGRLPCSQELPGSSPSPVVPEAPALANLPTEPPVAAGARLPAVTAPRPRPRFVADAPDRPPRTGLASTTPV